VPKGWVFFLCGGVCVEFLFQPILIKTILYVPHKFSSCTMQTDFEWLLPCSISKDVKLVPIESNFSIRYWHFSSDSIWNVAIIHTRCHCCLS